MKFKAAIAKPGDILVLSTTECITREEAETMKARVAEAGLHALIIDGDVAGPITINIPTGLTGSSTQLAQHVAAAIEKANRRGALA